MCAVDGSLCRTDRLELDVQLQHAFGFRIRSRNEVGNCAKLLEVSLKDIQRDVCRDVSDENGRNRFRSFAAFVLGRCHVHRVLDASMQQWDAMERIERGFPFFFAKEPDEAISLAPPRRGIQHYSGAGSPVRTKHFQEFWVVHRQWETGDVEVLETHGGAATAAGVVVAVSMVVWLLIRTTLVIGPGHRRKLVDGL